MSNFPICKCNACAKNRAKKALEMRHRYVLHSMGTATGNRAGEYIAGASTLVGALSLAKENAASWRKSHKGIVIYKAVKVVRTATPPIEVIDV